MRTGPRPRVRPAALGAACLLLAILLGSTACGRPARADGGEDRSAVPEATRDLVDAFRTWVNRYHEARFLAEEEAGTSSDLAAAETALREARDTLDRAMVRAGLVAREGAASLPELVPVLEDHLSRTSDLVFVPTGPDGVLLGRVGRRTAGVRRTLLDREVRYHRVEVVEVVVPDYPTYRARALDRPPPLRTVAWRGRTIYLVRPEARRVGEELFLPRLDHYRDLDAELEERGPSALVRGPGAEVLTRLKDALRWRSLEDLVHETDGSSPEARLEAFADRWLAHEEVLAAARILLAPGDDAREEDAVHRIRRAHLLRLAEGDPLAALATLFALHLRGRMAGEDAPIPAEVAAAGEIVRAIPRLARSAPDEVPTVAAAALTGERAAWASLLEAPERELRALGRIGFEAGE